MKFNKNIWLMTLVLLNGCSSHGPYKPFSHLPFTHHEKNVEKDDARKENVNEPNEEDGPPYVDRDVTHIPNAVPKLEPLSRFGNPASYEALGSRYQVLSKSKGYEESGTASWYGRKFHGARTSSGEPYDMYGMTAAHRSLPIPTYAKVKNLDNGREVIVKINDRGPFVKDRLIDLSYAAAKKLGIHATGTGKVIVAAIDPIEWHNINRKKENKMSHQRRLASNKGKKTTTKLAAKSTENASSPIVLAEAKETKTTQKLATKVSTKPATKTTNKQLYVQLGSFSKKDNAQSLAAKATILTAALKPTTVHTVIDSKTHKNLYKVRVGPLKNEAEAKKLQKKLVALNEINSTKLIYE